MIYIFVAIAALLAIAYIVYLVLDLLGRRKLAERYGTWEPDLEQYYRKHPSHPQPTSHHTDKETQEKVDRICEILNELHEMQGQR